MKDSLVHLRDAVHALTSIGVDVELAVEMVWARRMMKDQLYVMERALLDHWIAELEGVEEDVDGS